MHSRAINLVGLLLASLSASCASDVANRYYGSVKYPPKPVDQVLLLDHAPDRPYTVIADLQSRGESPEDMRRKAAKLGADAVIVTTLGDYAYSQSEEWAQNKNANVAYTRIVGTAVRFNH